VEDADARPTHYFLVEVWIERSAIGGVAPLARARLRDLGTDREAYVKSVAEMAAFFDESLTLAGIPGVRWHEGL
jgi:hypothetical protein